MSTAIVDQAALNLFHLKDTDYDAAYDHHSSSDLATLRYLALRAVGLQSRGFTDQEQVKYPKFLAAGQAGSPLSRDCASVGAVFLSEHNSISPHEQTERAMQKRWHIEQDTPAWEAFHRLLLNARSKFKVSRRFDVNHYTDTLKIDGGYHWVAERGVRNKAKSRGRVFVNPLAAAQWFLAEQPGSPMGKGAIHASYMICPDTHHSFYAHGTSMWAKEVLRKTEVAILTLMIQDKLTEHSEPRPRI